MTAGLIAVAGLVPTPALAAPGLPVAAVPVEMVPGAASPQARDRLAGPPSAPTPVCSVDDDRLAELSGLAVDGARWWAIADGGRSSRAFALNPDGCAVTEVRSDPVDPRDVEDVALGPGGTLWLSDTGDNTGDRPSAAVIELPTSGPARLHRLTYPDGPHDAEALVVGDDGVPVVITKTTTSAGVYRPTTPLGRSGNPTPTARVGGIVLPPSDTPGGPLGALGARTVTGAALSPPAPSGRVVAVRTYTDAWLFRLPPGRPADADTVVDALRGAPVRVPLPDEAQGEAVAFTADGALLSGSEARDGRPAAVRRVDDAVGTALATDAVAVPQPDRPPPGSTERSEPSWTPATLAIGAVTVVLAGLVMAMTVHSRRRRGRG